MGVSITVSRRLLCFIVLFLVFGNCTARRPGGRPVGGSGSNGSGGSSSGSGGSSSGSGGSSSGSGGNGVSGGGSNVQHTYPPSNGFSGTSYRPPQQITHGSNTFPVSQTAPPTYVYYIRDSGSRYNNLLTGLALWNIGRRPTTSNNNNNNNYEGKPDEVCKFRLDNNRTVEDRVIDCKTISSFIEEWENSNSTNTGNSTNTAGVGQVVVENNVSNGTHVMDALEDKGESILVTPDMTCYILRTWNSWTTTQQVDCEVLQLYTANSWRNGAERLAPTLITLVSLVFFMRVF